MKHKFVFAIFVSADGETPSFLLLRKSLKSARKYLKKEWAGDLEIVKDNKYLHTQYLCMSEARIVKLYFSGNQVPVEQYHWKSYEGISKI